jgi:hypothetical protein
MRLLHATAGAAGAAGASHRVRVLSEETALEVEYLIETNVYSDNEVESPPSAQGIASTLREKVENGHFTSYLQQAATVYGASQLAWASSDASGLYMDWNGESDDDGGENEDSWRDGQLGIMIFVLVMGSVAVVLMLCSRFYCSCCGGGKPDNMSLADRARTSGGSNGSSPRSPGAAMFDGADPADLELSWVQTSTGMVRTTRRRSDMTRTPLAGHGGGEKYRGISADFTVPSATPGASETGTGTTTSTNGSSAFDEDPFSNEQPIFDLLGQSPAGISYNSNNSNNSGGVPISPSTGTMRSSSTTGKIAINLRGVGNASSTSAITTKSRQQQHLQPHAVDDTAAGGLDDFLAIAARAPPATASSSSSSPAKASSTGPQHDDDLDGMLF